MFKKRKFYSLSNWEESFYGGYWNVLNRHPEVSTDTNISWKMREDKPPTISYYMYDKLIKMFLLRVKDKDLSETMIKDMSLKEQENRYTKKKEDFLEMSQHSVQNCIIEISSDRNHELSNLFSYYKDVIVNSSIRIPLNKGDQARKMLISTKVRKFKFITPTSWSSSQEPYLEIGTEYSSGPYVVSKEELILANKLVDMLDISFDPTYGRVDNLKNGKLNTNKLAEISCGNLNVYYHDIEHQSTRPFSVCILGDQSGSMSGDKSKLLHSMTKILWEAFTQILPPEKIFVYGHTTGNFRRNKVTNSNVPKINVYNDPYNLDFERKVNEMNKAGGNNYDAEVIEFIHTKVREFTEDNILFICISDGLPCGDKPIPRLKAVVEKCKRDGFVTAGIGLIDSTVKEIYNNYLVLKTINDEAPLKISRLLNHVVKTEFQD